MGISESTSRSNHTEEENSSGGIGTAMAIAAGCAVAYGISRILWPSADQQDEENDDRMEMKASATTEPYYISESSTNGPVAWSPPPFGRYKMNTDGNARPNPGGPSGYGGILRDHHGNWIAGFRGFIGLSDGLTAEFHGILKGLELLDRFGLKNSILESDCTGAVDWIKKGDAPYLRHSKIIPNCLGIIAECRRLVRKNNITINHVSEDFNKCADKLATMAIKNRDVYVEMMEVPRELMHFVKAESPSISRRSLYL